MTAASVRGNKEEKQTSVEFDHTFMNNKIKPHE